MSETEKLKKKIEILEENLQVVDDLLDYVIRELGFPEDTIIVDEFSIRLNEKYISKEKIREKIKELENKRDKEILTITSALFQRDINTLQELLGDEK